MAGKAKQGPPTRLDAEPTKRFFVRMLVRDIELVPAIVDLVDNCVDGARREVKGQMDAKRSGRQSARPSRPLAKYSVDIALDGTAFEIKDDCGGISLDNAVNYAFRFGRPEDVAPLEGEVGQFGVGMKRALFKIGQSFSVASVAKDSEFKVDVDVEDWLKKKSDWTFPLTTSGPRKRGQGLGTTIRVTDLLPSVAGEFDEDSFVQRLRDQIEFRHNTAIEEGLKVTLNGYRLKGRAPALLSGPEILPRVVSETIGTNGESVEMKLYAGFVDLQDENADTDDPDEFSGGNQAGWYLICNGRMLLFADRSRLTGWGLEVADYHPQYRRFRGYVFLTGNSSAMPWNTAKTTVDEDSAVWRAVRTHIVDALRDARSVMNRIKSEVQNNEENARPITAMLKASHPTRLAELDENPEITVPPRPPKSPPTTKRITYEVAIDEFDEVAEALEVSSAADVGRETFAYYYRREVE
ncbi:MAG: ATP-binding protein [Solirubrobacterales bacterium]